MLQYLYVNILLGGVVVLVDVDVEVDVEVGVVVDVDVEDDVDMVVLVHTGGGTVHTPFTQTVTSESVVLKPQSQVYV